MCKEIQRCLGEQTTWREVVECAQLIIDTYDEDSKVDTSFGNGRLTLDQKPLYQIFEEDSWHIYLKESPSDCRSDLDADLNNQLLGWGF